MNISLIGSILFMLSEGFMAYYTKSHSLLMDCIFDVTDLIMIGPFMVLVPLLYKPVTEKRPYGFSQVESLFVVIKYSVLLVITIQLVWDNLYTIFHGGRHVDGGSIAVFELAVCAGCLIIYILMYYFSRKYASLTIQCRQRRIRRFPRGWSEETRQNLPVPWRWLHNFGWYRWLGRWFFRCCQW